MSNRRQQGKKCLSKLLFVIGIVLLVGCSEFPRNKSNTTVTDIVTPTVTPVIKLREKRLTSKIESTALGDDSYSIKTTYEYDLRGNCIRESAKENGAGINDFVYYWTREYDEMNRITKLTESSKLTTREFSYTYEGNTVTLVCKEREKQGAHHEEESTVIIENDSQGNPVKRTADGCVESRKYDDNNRLLEMEIVFEGADNLYMKTNYEYDECGRVICEKTIEGEQRKEQIVRYTYQISDSILEKSYRNEDGKKVLKTSEFDEEGDIIRIVTTIDGKLDSKVTFYYEWLLVEQLAPTPTLNPESQTPTQSPGPFPTSTVTPTPIPTLAPGTMDSFAKKFYDVLPGQKLTFGRFEQNDIKSDGMEEISWLVLAREGNNVLIVSEYALTNVKFNETDTSVTWDKSSLREWLNKTFFNEAFTQEEQRRIQKTVVHADPNPVYATAPGKDTKDQVFLLSIDEVLRYLPQQDKRKCEPTWYLEETLGVLAEIKTGHRNCAWLLRTRGEAGNMVTCVFYNGVIDYEGSEVNSSLKFAIRPAMWINVEPQ